MKVKTLKKRKQFKLQKRTIRVANLTLISSEFRKTKRMERLYYHKHIPQYNIRPQTCGTACLY